MVIIYLLVLLLRRRGFDRRFNRRLFRFIRSFLSSFELLGWGFSLSLSFYWLLCKKTDSPNNQKPEVTLLKKDDEIVVPDDVDGSNLLSINVDIISSVNNKKYQNI